jgi:dolichol-phosphate mannosyltransferase
MKNAVIILPTYNERENVSTLIPKIFEVAKDIDNWKVSILVVDDESPDNTYDAVAEMQKKYKNLVLIRGKKEGLGKAYYRGFNYAIENLNPFVMFEMDADWSHDPELIPSFLKEIELGADFVIGSRYIKGGSIPSEWAWHRKLFSVLGNIIIKFGFMNLRLNDWTSGYRCIKTWFIKEVIEDMTGYTGYVWQIALLDRAKKMGLTIKEVPLKFIDRALGKSKINSVQYITNTLLYVLFNSSFIKFGIVGGIGFIIDFGLLYFLKNTNKLAIGVNQIFSAEAAIISNFILNNYWSFSYKKIENTFSAYLKSFLNFNFVSLGSLIIQSVLLQIATMTLYNGTFNFYDKEVGAWAIYKVLILFFIIIPYSYYMYNYVIWKKK